jgi:hypothetical protein
VKRIIDLYMEFSPEMVVTDQGQGETQWELLMLESERMGLDLHGRLVKLNFGAKMEVPSLTGETDTERKYVKPFLVGILQRKLQEGEFHFPSSDRDLEEQFLMFKIAKSSGTRLVFASERDHAIDAILFSMYGVFCTFEDFYNEHSSQSSAIRKIPGEQLVVTTSAHEEELWRQLEIGRSMTTLGGGVYRTNLDDMLRGGFWGLDGGSSRSDW